MKRIDVDARLFQIASRFRGRDQRRHSLMNTYVEPHPDGGALIIATNNHALICIHDRSGKASTSGGIQLTQTDRAVLKGAARANDWRVCAEVKETKNSKGVYDAKIWLLNPNESNVLLASGVVFSDYPDWRGVVSKIGTMSPAEPAIYNAGYVAKIAKAGRALMRIVDGKPSLVSASYPKKDAPGLFVWPGVDFAFAALTPMQLEVNWSLPDFARRASTGDA